MLKILEILRSFTYNGRKNKENLLNKFLRFTFILAMLAMLGAALIQIFLPQLLGSRSQEIGFWNLAILPLLMAVNIKYDWFYLRMILLALILGGLGFGTNHLIGYLTKANQANLLGWTENYLLVVLWLIGWAIEVRKRQKSDEESAC